MTESAGAIAESQELALGQLAEAVNAGLRHGREPDVEHLIREHPELADQIRQLVPALVSLHQIGHETNHQFSDGRSLATGAPVAGQLGDYRIVREIGRGGMGVVYEAEQISLGRRVALKVLPFAAVLDQRQLQRFKNEAQAAALLHHQNIVPVHGIGCERGVHYYAMQYVEGQTLAQIIASLRKLEGLDTKDVAKTADQEEAIGDHLNWFSGEKGGGNLVCEAPEGPSRQKLSDPLSPQDERSLMTDRLPTTPEPVSHTTPEIKHLVSTERSIKRPAYFRSIVELGIQVADALEHAHSEGVVHRDIKPSNLILESSGRVWVTDFGLARIESDCGLTMTGDLVGTIRYMSPEQALAKRVLVDHRTDIYSLGVTLYELLTLEPAFNGRDRQELLRQIAFEEPRGLRRINSASPAELETIVLKAMAKSPQERYATAQELADDLRRFREDRPIRARRTTVLGHARRWCRRNAALAIVSGLAAAAFLAGAAGYSLALHQSRIAERLREAQNRTTKALELAHTEREVATRQKAEADGYRLQAQRVSATLAMERGLFLCERGDAATGLLWLGHGLTVVPGQDVALEREIRSNLANWLHQVHPLRAALPHGLPIEEATFSPGGQTILTASHDKTARVWEADTGRLVATLQHDDKILYACFSSDGKLIATASLDRTARLWNASTGQPLHTQPLRHQDAVRSVAFNSGRWLVTGSWDHTAQVWDVVTGQPVGPKLEHSDAVLWAAFSPDDRLVATASRDHTARLWDATTGEPIVEPLEHNDSVGSALFSPSGKVLVTISGNRVYVWDVAKHSKLGELEHTGMITDLVFNSNGQLVLTGSLAASARVWDLSTCKPRGSDLVDQSAIYSVAISPDESRVLTGSDDGLSRLWDEATRKPIGMPMRHKERVECVKFSPDGKRILTGTYDGTAWLRDVATGDRASISLHHPSPVLAVASSRDGNTVLTGCADGSAWLWDSATGNLLRQLGSHRRHILDVTFSPDDTCVAMASADSTAQLWEIRTAKHLFTMQHADQVRSVAISPDGQTIVTACYNTTARLWDRMTGEQLHVLSHGAQVVVAEFSPDGRFLLTGCEDAAARLWNVATGKQVGAPLQHHSGVNSGAFSPDGKTVVTGSDDQTAVLWDFASRRSIMLRHQSAVTSVAFSPNGSAVVTGSADWTAQIWDAHTGERRCQPLEHQGSVLAVAFSPDGQSVVTTSADGTARLWDAGNGKPLGGALRHEGPVGALTYSPDGQTIVTASLDKTARLWRPLAPLQGEPNQIVLSLQVQTGLELDADGVVHVLDASTWQERKRSFEHSANQSDGRP